MSNATNIMDIIRWANEGRAYALLRKFANHQPDCRCFICRALTDDDRAFLAWLNQTEE